MIKTDEIEIEDVDDSWYWQITQRKMYLPQICLSPVLDLDKEEREFKILDDPKVEAEK